ncbi:MAG: glycosyltransferase [Vicinamibacteria bacterium]|jgi:glycosyltransferase involved in cell wall biosynthesis|nr:glycosyltransferase [Vicinamibacteria bacterium]
MRFSAVIPARNEEQRLPRLLDTLAAASERFAGGSSAIEVIVADNLSTDHTRTIAEQRGCRVVSVAPHVIASVRNGGAAAATGEILVFIDADIRAHVETFGVIDRAMATGRYVAGATGVHLERMSLGLAATYAMLMPLVWLLKMDTGPTFCRRADFEAIGGYDESLPYAEDVDLLVRLRKLGRQSGRGLARLGAARAIADLRKFDRHGDWHYFKLAAHLAWWWIAKRRGRDGFAERYWYSEKR